MYLAHVLAILFVRAWLARSARRLPNLGSAMFGLAVFAGGLAMVLIFAQFTERRTNAVRGRVERPLDLLKLLQLRRRTAGTADNVSSDPTTMDRDIHSHRILCSTDRDASS